MGLFTLAAKFANMVGHAFDMPGGLLPHLHDSSRAISAVPWRYSRTSTTSRSGVSAKTFTQSGSSTT